MGHAYNHIHIFVCLNFGDYLRSGLGGIPELQGTGDNRSQVLARNEITFATASDLYDTQADHNLGNLLSDAFKYAVSNFCPVWPDGVLWPELWEAASRKSFPSVHITVEDVFNAYSLGIGLDGVAGYPLISIYLTGAELKTGAEIDLLRIMR